MAHHKVALKTHEGSFIGALENEALRIVPHSKEWEFFELVPQSGNKIAIKTFKGLFISARDKEPVAVKAVSQCRDWEWFELVRVEDRHVAFKSAHHNYLSATGSGLGLSSNLGKNEQFKLISHDHLPDKASLKTHHGTFIGALENETLRLVPHNRGWELFDIDRVGEQVSIKTFKGLYISARDKENVDVKAVPVRKEWELFELVPLDGHHKFAFLSAHHSYLAAHGHADKGLYLSRHLNNDTTFELVH